MILEYKVRLGCWSDSPMGALFVEEVEILAEEIRAVSREKPLWAWQGVLCTAHIIVYLTCVERAH